MTLKEILKNTITKETHLEDIYYFARQEKYYKESTIERELRRLTEEGLISPIKRKTYIVAYKPSNSPTKPISSPTSDNTEELNNTLKDMLDSMIINWENQKIVKELNDAINSKNLYLKQGVIKKYE